MWKQAFCSFCKLHRRLITQCWALPQINLQVRKLQTQGFDLQICKTISYRKRLRICGKKNLSLPQIRKAATSLGCLFAIYKTCVFTVQCIGVGWMCLYSATPLCGLAKFRWSGTIIFHGCCYFHSETSKLNVKKLPTACFSEGILGLFEMARGCTR